MNVGSQSATVDKGDLLSVCIPMRFPEEDLIVAETCDFWHRLTAEESWPRLELIIVINGDEAFEAADRVKTAFFGADEDRVRVLTSPESHSKAGNINHALGVASGEVFAIFDADSRPSLSCLHRGWAKVHAARRPEIVIQGSKAIRRPRAGASLSERLVHAVVELEHCFNYMHYMPVRAWLYRQAYSAGSNTFANTKSLARVKYDERALVEDVEMSMRTASLGYDLHYEMELVCHEDAPPSVRALIQQRRRWFRGWSDASLQNSKSLWVCARRDKDWRLGVFWFSVVTTQVRVAATIALVAATAAVLGFSVFGTAAISVCFIWIVGLALLEQSRRRIRRRFDSDSKALLLDGSMSRHVAAVFLLPIYLFLMLGTWLTVFHRSGKAWRVTARSRACRPYTAHR